MSNYCKGVDYIVRGSRCYGIPLKDTGLFYTRYLRSWLEKRMWKFLDKNFKNLKVIILSVKRITNFKDVFMRIKIFGSSDEISKANSILNDKFPNASISFLKFSKRNHKFTFSSLRRQHPESFNVNQLNSQRNSTASSSNSHCHTVNSNNSNLPNCSIHISPNSPVSNPTSSISSNTQSITHQPNTSNISSITSSNSSAINLNTFSFCLSWNTNG